MQISPTPWSNFKNEPILKSSRAFKLCENKIILIKCPFWSDQPTFVKSGGGARFEMRHVNERKFFLKFQQGEQKGGIQYSVVQFSLGNLSRLVNLSLISCKNSFSLDPHNTECKFSYTSLYHKPLFDGSFQKEIFLFGTFGNRRLPKQEDKRSISKINKKQSSQFMKKLTVNNKEKIITKSSQQACM